LNRPSEWIVPTPLSAPFLCCFNKTSPTGMRTKALGCEARATQGAKANLIPPHFRAQRGELTSIISPLLSTTSKCGRAILQPIALSLSKHMECARLAGALSDHPSFETNPLKVEIPAPLVP
jgi:hypothetical protein